MAHNPLPGSGIQIKLKPPMAVPQFELVFDQFL
jgi:hypothetical protein